MTGYIVTNSHVISSTASEVTLFPGTERETTVTGRVAAEDPDWDLAVLAVEFKDLPRAIELGGRNLLKETSPINIIGFPYGQALQTGARMPAPTITRGMVSSLHRDFSGELELIQLDGSADPGNSGGPVVDRTGALAGVLVAGIPGTRTTFAIPATRVQKLLQGRIPGFTLKPGENKNRRLRVKAVAPHRDPLQNIKEAALLYVKLDQLKEPARENPAAPAAAGMSDLALVRGEKDFEGEWILEDSSGKDVLYLCQVRYTRKDGEVIHTATREFRAPFSKGEVIHKDMDDWIEGGNEKPAEKKPPASGSPPSPGPSKPELPQIPTPSPEDTGVEIAGPRTVTGDLGSREITFPGVKLTGIDVVWSEDGRWAWVLDSQGVVRRISIPTLREERKLSTGRRQATLGICREGLVLYSVDVNPAELWLMDPATLKVTVRIPVPGSQKVLASPAGAFVYVVNRDDGNLLGLEMPSGRQVFSISGMEVQANTGADSKRHSSARLHARSWRTAAVTPDGRFVLTSETGSLRRFNMSASSPRLEETGPQVLVRDTRFAISPDSKYVAVAIHDRQEVADLREPGTYIFRVSDFSKPVARLPLEGRLLAFDKAAGRIYMTEGAGSLIAYDPNGSVVARFGGGPIQFSIAGLAVHRDGRQGFLMMSGRNYWFDMTK
jgi:hypothetical protein